MIEEKNQTITWKPNTKAFLEWLGGREAILEPGLVPEPTSKVLLFLALFDAGKSCSYDDLRAILNEKNVVEGNIPDNTLRTSVSLLGKSLDKSNHSLELKSLRGRFQLIKRIHKTVEQPPQNQDPAVLLLYPPAVTAEDIAKTLIEKAFLSLPGLYFLEWSARWWETYSSKEAEIRVHYETESWEHLGVKKRLLKRVPSEQILSVVGLAPGEGLAEIGLLKKILRENTETIHYLAIDSSPKLLRDHIGLLKETLAIEIDSGRLICAGVVADIFSSLPDALKRVRFDFKLKKSSIDLDFLPSRTPMLATYFGNCLGNNYQDQEIEFFSMIQSIFQNRPLEILTGVSVMRDVPDNYIRNWDDFLLQSPKHLLETKNLLTSSRPSGSQELPEFTLTHDRNKNERCPPVIPEQYIVRHQIEGQIYRFYYKLAFDLELKTSSNNIQKMLPKGTLILLHSIIKYNMKTLVEGIKKSGVFQIAYDPAYHQIVDTSNGKREYAVFSVFFS